MHINLSMRFELPCVENSELVFQNTKNGNEKAVCTLRWRSQTKFARFGFF